MIPRPAARAISEPRVVFLVGAVQFVNILDFTMVMPLGPDFTRALGIPASNIGYITSAYTAAAALIGFLGSFFLDRFDRRSALSVIMVGLGVATAAGGLANNLSSLLAARLLAGLFGGPGTSVALSIIADVIPRERRGKAMGSVAGALSVAQVLGIPAGLWLARVGGTDATPGLLGNQGWRLPFFAVGVLGLLAALGAVMLLPSLRGHLRHQDDQRSASLSELLSRPVVQLSYAMTAVVMGAGFLIVPNLATFIQTNLHYPRNHLERLYIVGGTATFITNRLFGRVVDRLGSWRVAALSAALMIPTMYVYLMAPPPGLPVMLVHVTFLVILSARNVAYNTLTTQVPRPDERARFLSLQSTVYHLASSLGASSSARLMHERPDGTLAGMDHVAVISMGMTAVFPLLLWMVEKRVRQESAQAGEATRAPQ